MPIQHINPDEVFKPRGDGYTQVVTSTGSKIVHVAGITGKNKNYELVGEDMATQVRVVMENIVMMLKAGGATCADVVHMNIYTTDVPLYLKEGAAEANKFFDPGKRPTGVLAGVTALADPKCAVEIEATAVLD